MLNNEVMDTDQSLVSTSTTQKREVEISEALPVRLQTLDLARHTVIAPDEKRYVVATFDDTRLGRGYVTAIYPQQNGYLTLIRLVVREFRSETPDQAIKQHISAAQMIQQGKLDQLVNSSR